MFTLLSLLTPPALHCRLAAQLTVYPVHTSCPHSGSCLFSYQFSGSRCAEQLICGGSPRVKIVFTIPQPFGKSNC